MRRLLGGGEIGSDHSSSIRSVHLALRAKAHAALTQPLRHGPQASANNLQKPPKGCSFRCMPQPRLAFGPFVLNSENGTLLRQGLPVPVGYRGIRLLGALIRSPGEVMTKSALMDAAWQGMAVEEA